MLKFSKLNNFKCECDIRNKTHQLLNILIADINIILNSNRPNAKSAEHKVRLQIEEVMDRKVTGSKLSANKDSSLWNLC